MLQSQGEVVLRLIQLFLQKADCPQYVLDTFELYLQELS
jgi:hypothetical protein